MGGSCNIFEVISLDIDVPTNLEYSPVLTVYVYDHVMGFMGTRLVGVANIPLEKFCRKVLDKLTSTIDAFKILGSPNIDNMLNISEINVKSKFKNLVHNKNSHQEEGTINNPNDHLFENNVKQNPLVLSI